MWCWDRCVNSCCVVLWHGPVVSLGQLLVGLDRQGAFEARSDFAIGFIDLADDADRHLRAGGGRMGHSSRTAQWKCPAIQSHLQKLFGSGRQGDARDEARKNRWRRSRWQNSPAFAGNAFARLTDRHRQGEETYGVGNRCFLPSPNERRNRTRISLTLGV